MIALLASLALIVNDAYVTFYWQPPPEGPPSHYEVRVQASGADPVTFTTTQAAFSYQPGLGRELSIDVRACSDGLCGPWSAASDPISFNRSADFNGDSVVGLPDHKVLLAQIGETSGDDLTGDGIVGLPDLMLFYQRIGQCIGEVVVSYHPLQQDVFDAYVPCP